MVKSRGGFIFKKVKQSENVTRKQTDHMVKGRRRRSFGDEQEELSRVHLR